MASIARLSKGWRAQIAIKGTRDSKVFSTKAEAVSWSSKRETEIREGDTAGIQRVALSTTRSGGTRKRSQSTSAAHAKRSCALVRLVVTRSPAHRSVT